MRNIIWLIPKERQEPTEYYLATSNSPKHGYYFMEIAGMHPCLDTCVLEMVLTSQSRVVDGLGYWSSLVAFSSFSSTSSLAN